MNNIARYFAQWQRDAKYQALGRIYFDPNKFVFEEDAKPPATEADARTRFPREDENGRVYVLVHGRATWCIHEQWADKYPKCNTSRYSVPYGACSKCEHYRKSSKKFRFPRCMYVATAQNDREARSHAARDMISLIDEATSRTEDILK